jgi:putative endonuclease
LPRPLVYTLDVREHRYYVYILASASKVLYVGMTKNLRKRVWEHRTHAMEGFTDDYNVCRLVYWERFQDVRNAIDREKQIKRWRRSKKIMLIEMMNRDWHDLSEGWYADSLQPFGGVAEKQKTRRSHDGSFLNARVRS